MNKANKYDDFLSDADIMNIYKENPKAGIEVMIEKYSDYIYYVIKKHYPSFIKEASDMYQNGVIGLINAMKRYHPEKGAFFSYSTPFIKKELSSYVRFVAAESSEYFAAVHNSVERAKTKLETEGKPLSVELIMKETGLSNKIVKREMKVDRTKVSYDSLTECGTNMSLSDNFIVEDMLSCLPDIRKKIIKLKIIDEFSFRDIAKKLDASEFYVKKEYNNGLDTLRKICS